MPSRARNGRFVKRKSTSRRRSSAPKKKRQTVARRSTKLDKLKQARAAASRRAREKKAGLIRKGGIVAAGYLEGSGRLDFLPSIGPLGRHGTGAAIGLVGGMFLSGTAGDLLEGFGDAMLAFAARDFGESGAIEGASANDIAALEAELDRLDLDLEGAPEMAEAY